MAPRPLASRPLLRLTVGALLALIVLAVGSVSAASWYFTDQLVTPDHSAPRFDIAVHDASSKTVELDKTNDTLRPGVWGLEWPAGHAIVGAITSISSSTVNRVLVRATAPLSRGLRVAMNSQVFWDDPEDSFGIPSQTVDVPSELGSLPDWFVPGSPTDFAIVVHGRNAPITDGMRLVPALVDLGLSILLIRYRNDVGSPPSPDHLLHLGDTEWRDLQAAVQWAVARGAQRIVLVGISMGGAVVEMFMERSSIVRRIAALVLDSPVLSWDALLRFQADRRHLPYALVGSTELVFRLRIGFDFGTYDAVRDAGSIHVPILLFQDGQETLTPPDRATALARARPDLVEYHFYPQSGHVEEWNADPSGYTFTLRAFLARTLNLLTTAPTA